jgi:hypothetical protein
MGVKLGHHNERVCRLRVSEKNIWVTGECRKQHNEEFNDLYSSPNIVLAIKSGRMRWAEHVAHMRGRRVVYRQGNLREKGPLGRPRCRWEDNNKGLQEVGCGGMGWTDLAQNRDRWRALLKMVMDLQVPYNVGNS